MKNRQCKLFITVFVSLIISLNVFAQLSFRQLTKIKFGEVFSISRPKIKSMFVESPTITKSDFLGAYKIEYENIAFDYYGNANYTFQYVKDTLVSVTIDFDFFAQDTVEFRRLLNTIIDDVNNNKDFLRYFNDLDIQKTIIYLNKNCKTTSDKESKDYKPINTKYFGNLIGGLFEGTDYTGNKLRLYAHLYEKHIIKTKNGLTTSYDGGVANITLEIFPD
jgi:hypothetical protein